MPPSDLGVARASRKAPRGFRGYAAMEAFNIALLPGAAVLMTGPDSAVEWLALGAASIAAGTFLLVGARYWQMLDRRLRLGERNAVEPALRLADRLERPGLAAIAAGALLSIVALVMERGSGPAIAASVLTLLAALEWVNYYRVQLQHFDNAADLRRLLRGRGFRAAHLGRELAEWRRRRLACSPAHAPHIIEPS